MFTVSSCYSDDTEHTHLILTRGLLSHGQPDQRQSGDRIGVGWQRYILGPSSLCPSSPWPQRQARDNI